MPRCLPGQVVLGLMILLNTSAAGANVTVELVSQWGGKTEAVAVKGDLLYLGVGSRLVVLDTRVPSMWQIAHIEGAVPIPYYHDGIAGLTGDLPDDGTLIVSYCECPRAAAESVTRKLRAAGFPNTAVLYEGIQGWIALGYPVSVGQLSSSPD